MNKLTFLVLFFISSCTVQKEIVVKDNFKFNLDAVEAYLHLADKLVNNETITEQEWVDYFKVEGNDLYLKENGVEDRKDAMRESIEIVFTEKNDSIIDQLAEENPYIIYQKRYKNNFTKVKQFYKTLNNNPAAYRASMLNLAKQYLPPRMHQIDSFPKIYYHALGEPSANPSGLFFDLMVDYDCNQELYASMAAHELHHQMRYSVVEDLQLDSIDEGLVWALDAVLNEGIADIVDKEQLLSEGSNWWMKDLFKPIIDVSPDVIQNLDELIQNETNGTHLSSYKYRSVLMNSVGHIPGYFMALKIKQNGRLADLIENADNPFVFFMLYDEVVKVSKENLPSFSTESINYIKSLNKKYIK